jgi:hypothetical protein
MKIAPWLVRLSALFAVLLGLLAFFLIAVRPWHRSWGATVWEQRGWLPGDEIVRGPRRSAASTHGVTIEAPASEDWLWVAQLGQDRGGFYSYEILEDLVGCEMENTDRTHSEFQHWELGDKLWMYPPNKLNGMGHAVLKHLSPGSALGFATRQIGTPPGAPDDGSWSFVVKPIGDEKSRLLVRSRAGGERSLAGEAFDLLVFEPMHFTMERNMMENIKAHAEGKAVFAAADTLEVLLWTITVALGMLAAVRMFRDERWGRQIGVVVAAALVLQILTFIQPSLVTGFMLVGFLAWLVWASHQQARGTSPAQRPTAPSSGLQFPDPTKP